VDCVSKDGLTEVVLDDSRARHMDRYDGLNELTFCKDGYLKISGYEFKKSDFGLIAPLSSDYGIGMRDPSGKQVTTSAYVNFSLAADAKDASKAIQGSSGRLLYFGKKQSATLFILNEDSVTGKIELSCR
jgi:hypothetical protein